MARIAARDGATTSDAIREVAADLFFRRGYEATSLREVASLVGVQVGSLYNHIKSKDELLNTIMTDVLAELDDAMNEALRTAGPDAVQQLKAAIGCHIRYHAEHAREVFIGNSELRSLNASDRQLILARRRSYDRRMRELVRLVLAEADVDVLNVNLQTYALLAAGVHVSTWYRPDGSLGLEEIVGIYTRTGLRQLGIDDTETRARQSSCNRELPAAQNALPHGSRLDANVNPAGLHYQRT